MQQSGCPTLPLPSLPTDLSNTTTRQRSSPHATGWSKQPKHSQQAHYRPKSAPSSKSMNSTGSSLKKISMSALASGRLHLWQVLGFACGRRTIKTGKILWRQIKHLPTMGYGTDMLKSYENFIPHAKHYASKTFTTQIESLNCRLRHYLARLHRKTLCYRKSKTKLVVSLKLLIHKITTHKHQLPLSSTPILQNTSALYQVLIN